MAAGQEAAAVLLCIFPYWCGLQGLDGATKQQKELFVGQKLNNLVCSCSSTVVVFVSFK